MVDTNAEGAIEHLVREDHVYDPVTKRRIPVERDGFTYPESFFQNPDNRAGLRIRMAQFLLGQEPSKPEIQQLLIPTQSVLNARTGDKVITYGGANARHIEEVRLRDSRIIIITFITPVMPMAPSSVPETSVTH